MSNLIPDGFMERELARIERVRQRNAWQDCILVLPFVCQLCERERTDYMMITGDGCPMCQECFRGCEDALSGRKVVS